ncbi:nitrate/nitrite transporter NrtS [Nitrosospira sp. Nl5]|uniref:nitrate/nitrite transporter NrtS n=1 Tax=Nitrosospira sp. Nl5 TaxID=200120 RepID=UPI001C409A0D|nr:nitrate/nitrite transporter NrtS [Nitrosospira sp. Nl5]
MMRHLSAIKCSIKDRNARFVAFGVALIVGSCLLAINQGIPFLLGEPMTPGRWISAFVTPIVPFFVSCHGQGMKKAD